VRSVPRAGCAISTHATGAALTDARDKLLATYTIGTILDAAWDAEDRRNGRA
jgi:hypothetical protein